jgi:hypothetical protein
MNETQLRGWRPRRPSAGLKERIFRSREAVGRAPGWNWHQVAPALACVLFALMIFHFNGGGALRENRPVMYVDFTGGSNATTFSDQAQEMENHLAGVTFDWTNHSVFKSSMRSRTGIGPSTNLSN